MLFASNAEESAGRQYSKAQQFDRAMLEELFVIADAMAEVRPGTPESEMLKGGREANAG